MEDSEIVEKNSGLEDRLIVSFQDHIDKHLSGIVSKRIASLTELDKLSLMQEDTNGGTVLDSNSEKFNL